MEYAPVGCITTINGICCIFKGIHHRVFVMISMYLLLFLQFLISAKKDTFPGSVYNLTL